VAAGDDLNPQENTMAPSTREEVTALGVGLYFEDLPVGRKLRSLGRTIMDPDVCAFINVTHMNEVLFTDLEYVKAHSPIKGRVVPGALSYTFAEGLCIVDTMQHSGVAFLHMELDMKAPVFVGDTIHVEIEVIEARLTRSDPTRGLVRTRNTVVKQDGTVVLVYTPLRLVLCRPR
jgi:acyl dehydratase